MEPKPAWCIRVEIVESSLIKHPVCQNSPEKKKKKKTTLHYYTDLVFKGSEFEAGRAPPRNPHPVYRTSLVGKRTLKTNIKVTRKLGIPLTGELVWVGTSLKKLRKGTGFDEWVQGQKPRHNDLFKRKQFLGYGPQTNPYQEGGTRKGSCVRCIYGTEVLGDFRKPLANPSGPPQRLVESLDRTGLRRS